MPVLKVFVFGPPRLEREGQDIEVTLRKALALLVYLVVTKQPHSRDALATLLWPESDQSNARASLRRTLYRLNQAVGDEVLQVTADTVELNPTADVWLDVETYQQHVEACLPSGPPVDTLSPECLSRLTEATVLYTDDFLAGFTLPDSPDFDEWQFFTREALRQSLARVLEQLACVYQIQGEWEPAIDYMRRRLALDPLHEPVHRQLIQLYAWAGQLSAAQRQYRECARLLQEELGVAPEASTTALYDAVRGRRLPRPAGDTVQTLPRTTTSTLLAPRSTKSREPHLPRHLTSFVGRQVELPEITGRLVSPDCRLLTLVGPGGVGKTRLAIQVAEMLDDFADGIYFVNLQPVTSTTHLISAMADALHIPLSPLADPHDQLLAHLRDRQMLLILDNFEQLLKDNSPEVLSNLLAQAPMVKLLVTSRERLNLREEWLYRVQGLTFPGSDEVGPLETYAAVQLFVERARRVRPAFSMEDEAEGVVRICQLVEGMPLALEIAASWMRTLRSTEIAAEIQRNIEFLTTDLRNVPDRHRSARAVFTHSWQLLSEEEQKVFKQLSVFRGGFRRKAAEQVADASLITLTALVDKSLLQWEPNGRYQVHELLRQYAEEQLAQSVEDITRARERHCAYYSRFLEERIPDMLGRRQLEAAVEVEGELENIRVAWQWAVEHSKADELRRGKETLSLFYQFQSRYREGAEAFAKAVQSLAGGTRSREQDGALAPLLVEQGFFAIRLGQLDTAQQAFEQAVAIYQQLGIPPLLGMGSDPILGQAFLASLRGDYVEAARLSEEALQTSKRHDHPWNRQTAYYLLAGVAYAQGQYEAAQQHAQQAYTISQETGDRWFMAYCLNELGNAAYALGDDAAAEKHYAASYRHREAFDDPEGMAVALQRLGQVALRRRAYEEAEQRFARSVAIYRETSDKGGLATSLSGLGMTATAVGNIRSARRYFRQALQLAVEIQFVPRILSILTGVGELLLQSGHVERAVEWLTLVWHHPASVHETRERAQQLLQRHHPHFEAEHLAGNGQALTNSLELVIQEAQAELIAESTETIEFESGEAIPLEGPHSSPIPPPVDQSELVEPLTPRELEVLQLIAEGLTNREIAERLFVVLGTVKAHSNRIYGKLGVRNRVEAVARARELQLL